MLTERQAEIINVSINIIGNKGIQSLTIKNVSKKIGISEPAIYRHFESKTDILLAILSNFEEMASFMNEAINEMNETAIGKIEFLFSKIVDIFSQEPAQISVVFSEEIFKNEAILKNKIVEIMNQKEKAVENIIKKGQVDGEVRTDIDYKILALIIMGSLRFMVKQWELKNQDKNLKEESKKIIQSIKLLISK